MSNRLAAARLSASARSTSILQSTELSLPLFYFISVHENKFYTFFPPFFQVDLHFLKVLTGIATQGAISKETQKSYYVTTFKLEVSTNGEDWMVYRHGKNHKVEY